MTLRTRITLWHTGVLVLSLVIAAIAFHYELKENVHAAKKGSTPPDSPLEETGEFLVFGGIPAAVLLVVGSAWYIRRAMTPVKLLTEAAERLKVDRLPKPLVPTGAGDELDRLTEVFNAMGQRLHESFSQVRDFTLHASHELKTPLTVMRGELELALREDCYAGDRREFLAGLLDEVQRLSKIVDGLLLLAKADAGLPCLKFDSVRLDELVRESHADAQILGRSRAISVSLTGCDETWISGDRHRLRQLLLNLTDNAIKYNEASGRIEMVMVRGGPMVELSISNTGYGIAPDRLPRVFDRFFRGDPAHGSDVDGCGLGLSVAQWIVRAHGGEIRIASQLGSLTTVAVQLPILPAKPGPPI